MENSPRKNPWLGLESYKEGEILYGRDDDIRDLIQCVLNDTDTLLYGKSGIGKSSILNAGILPAARRNGYLPVIIRLSHKEDQGYLFQIKEAVISAMGMSGSDEDEISRRIRPVVDCKDPTKETVYEYFHRHTFHDTDGNRIKLLILFDQFEEIFTLQTDESRKKLFFAEMADFINDIMPNELQGSTSAESADKDLVALNEDNADDIFDDIDIGGNLNLPEYVNDNDIHFVFTIREDFLSEFEFYTAAIPSLKQNRYGLRPINDEQASQIILRPRPGLISVEVAKLIIEKVTGRSDFALDGVPEIEVDSAVLSLYLNRLYETKTSETITSDLVEQKGGEIISDFYDEAISDISGASIDYLEGMLINGQGRRDNITVYDAIHEGGLSQDELDILCNKKKILRQFNYAGVLRIEYIHDILCPIIISRKEKRDEEKRVRLIEASAREEHLKSRRRLIGVISAFIILALTVGAYLWFDWYYNESPLKEYYASYELRNGWPVGVGGKLSESQRAGMPLYYELSHPGHRTANFTSVRVCSSNQLIDKQDIIIPTLLHGIIPADRISGNISELQPKVRRILFNPTAEKDDNGEYTNLDYMAFLDGEDNLLFSMKCSQEGSRGKWFSFYDSMGRAMTISDTNIDRVNVLTDSIGFIASALYYDNNGVKRPLWNNIYGYVQSVAFNPEKNMVYGDTITTIDQFSQPTDELVNTYQILYGDDRMTVTFLYHDKETKEIYERENKNGFSKVVYERDSYKYFRPGNEMPVAYMKIDRDTRGNITQYMLDDPAGNLSLIPAKTVMSYDENGRLLYLEYLDSNGRAFSPGHAVFKTSYEYAPDGSLRYHEELADTGMVYLYKKEHLSENVVSTSLSDLRGNDASRHIPFFTRIDSIITGNTTVSLYFDRDGNPVNHESDDGQTYHKRIAFITDSIEEYTFFKVEDGQLLPADGENTYFHIIQSYDKDGNLLTFKIFDNNDKTVTSMMYFYKDGRQIGRAAMGIDSTPVRCDEWELENFLYYKLYYNEDFDGEFTDFLVVNEFDKPSLLESENTYLNFKYGNFKEIFDEVRLDGEKTISPIPVYLNKDYWQYYTEEAHDVSGQKVVFLHILDRDNILYKNGVRDGDIVYSCGSWRNGDDISLLKEQLSQHDRVVILSPKDNAYVKITVDLPRRMSNDDLESVHFHVMNLSDSEVKYFNK